MSKIFILLVALTWFSLPLLPALMELRRRPDKPDLQIDRKHAGQPTYFATDLVQRIAPLLPGTTAHVSKEGSAAAPGSPVVLNAPEGEVLYCSGPSHLSADLSVHAVLGADRLVLETGTRLHYWAHAVRVMARAHSNLGERLTADERVDLEAPVEFRRLHAPSLVFGAPMHVAPGAPVPLQVLDVATLPGVVHAQPGLRRFVVQGDLKVPPRMRIEASLVVLGDIELGEDCLVVGSLKSHGSILLGPNVSVQGSLVARKGVRAGQHCRLAGPVMGELWVELGQGVMVGRQSALTTVSTERLYVREGVVICGTAWARLQGRFA